MSALLQLQEHGQSYWLDNLTRGMLVDGTLARRVETEGLRGVTSNPAIFHNAITGSAQYDEDIARFTAAGLGVEDVYDRLTIADVQGACDVLRGVWESSGGVDGYVSLEVSPHLANDTEGTVREARRLNDEVARENVLIKIPGTPAGVPAIRQALFEGVNVNVTLLFSIAAYEAVADAHTEALEQRLVDFIEERAEVAFNSNLEIRGNSDRINAIWDALEAVAPDAEEIKRRRAECVGAEGVRRVAWNGSRLWGR